MLPPCGSIDAEDELGEMATGVRGRVVGQSGRGENVSVCSAGEEGERKKRMMAGTFLSVARPALAGGSMLPSRLPRIPRKP